MHVAGRKLPVTTQVKPVPLFVATFLEVTVRIVVYPCAAGVPMVIRCDVGIKGSEGQHALTVHERMRVITGIASVIGVERSEVDIQKTMHWHDRLVVTVIISVPAVRVPGSIDAIRSKVFATSVDSIVNHIPGNALVLSFSKPLAIAAPSKPGSNQQDLDQLLAHFAVPGAVALGILGLVVRAARKQFASSSEAKQIGFNRKYRSLQSNVRDTDDC